MVLLFLGNTVIFSELLVVLSDLGPSSQHPSLRTPTNIYPQRHYIHWRLVPKKKRVRQCLFNTETLQIPSDVTSLFEVCLYFEKIFFHELKFLVIYTDIFDSVTL